MKLTINGNLYYFEKGTSLLEISKVVAKDFPYKILIAKVNNVLMELFNPITYDCNIEFLDITTIDGWKIYRRSAFFLLAKVIKDLFPNIQIRVTHALNKGLYCELIGGTITREYIKTIRYYMLELVRNDVAFEKKKYTKEKAMEIFQDCKFEDKVKLLAGIDKQYVNIIVYQSI